MLTASPVVPAGLHNRLDYLIDGDHSHGWFDTPLGAKDLGLFANLGASYGVDAVLAGVARDRYLAAAERGLSATDVSAVVELLRGRHASPSDRPVENS